jgi:hypothetical protein
MIKKRTMQGLAAAMMLTIAVAANAAPGEASWLRTFSSGAGFSDGRGGAVLAVDLWEETDFGGGPITPVGESDVVIARYDSTGALDWLLQATPLDGFVSVYHLAGDEAGAVYASGVVWSGSVDFGGGPLAGENQAFVAKFGADGAHAWSRLVGVLEPAALTVAAGRLALAATSTDTVDFGGGPLPCNGEGDICVGVLDLDGGHLWSGAWGDEANQRCLGGGLDAAGNLSLAVEVAGSADFGGGALEAVDVDLGLVRFDGSGGHRWSNLFEGQFADWGYIQATVDVGADGRTALAGSCLGAIDLGSGLLEGTPFDDFVAVHDSTGTLLWADRWTDVWVQCASVGPAGSVAFSGVVTGPFDFGGGTLTGPGSGDLFLACLDADGSHLGSWVYGSLDWDEGLYVEHTPSGDLVASGFAAAGADFGTGPMETWGAYLGIIEGAAPGGGGGTSAVGPAPLLVTSVSGHPNPFNPVTTISYTVERAGEVGVAAYDLRGRLVAELVPPRAHEAGEHRVRFSPAASGVYLVRVSAGGHQQVVKMTAVK